MVESSRADAEAAAQAAVAHLTTQVEQLTSARADSRAQLTELRTKVDKALAVTEG